MGNYVTKAEVVAEGVPVEKQGYIDSRITKWEYLIEKLTGNVFRVISPGELTFDGSNMKYLHFSIPLISVSSLKINGDDTALATTEYRAYTGIAVPQDDRYNPKIELRRSSDSTIYTRYALTQDVFVQGLDQLVTATWGYVDPDPVTPGSYITPPPIKDAIIRLVILDLAGYFEAQEEGVVASVASPIRREKTDGHEIEYQQTERVSIAPLGIPQEIYEVLMQYRAPLMIAAPDARDLTYMGY